MRCTLSPLEQPCSTVRWSETLKHSQAVPEVSQDVAPRRDSLSASSPPPTPPMMPPMGNRAARAGAYWSGPTSKTRW